jgi:hypothetical protein
MADLFYTGSTTSSLNLDTGATYGTIDTGDLRRKYNFGDKVSDLALSKDPFFRFVSKLNKKPTDDPHFQFTEKRGSYQKRYAYVTGWVENDGTQVVGGTAGDADLTAYNDGGAPTSMSQGDEVRLYMSADYKSDGNVQNVFGQSSNAIAVGATGTRPAFFLPNQIVKVPLSTTDGGGAVADYLLCKVDTVIDGLTKDSRECVEIRCTVIRIPTVSGADYLAGWDGSDDVDTQVYDESIATSLEGKRSYVVGNAHKEGSGFPETWKDQPYSLKNGATQIWKTTMAMSNTARATVLRYEGNEWARIWRDKLIEHKWDIEDDMLFGKQYIDTTNGVQYTQGAVDYVLGAGNIFGLTLSTKTADDFLDDMSNYLDPRYNSSGANVFFCNTETYNWLHKLGGYFKNNLDIGKQNQSGAYGATNTPVFNADLAVTGRKKVLGLDTTVISTVYGDMHVVRNVHLDTSHVKILAMNMKYCHYRPLVGNGINRDTTVHVGVQTLENSGIDRRVDQIITEAGMEFGMAECHAIWK